MMKVNSMFTDTLMDWPADRISSGKISLGTSQANGPQDQAKPATYKHMNRTVTLPAEVLKLPCPDVPNSAPIMLPTTICNLKILYIN